MRHATVLLVLVVTSCTPAVPASERVSSSAVRSASAAALMAALADTASATRVYLPSEVATPAVSVWEPYREDVAAPGALAEPTVAVAAVRGVVDTLGFAERATLTVLPGSDPREGSLIIRRSERARWRPARLASGRAVRQLFEWRYCRDGNSSCIRFEQDSLQRGLPPVSVR